MTNVRRPIYLQLGRPAAVAAAASVTLAPACSPKALSPTGDALPSQILPHLFVGNQEQTNRDTVNRLNISYILSLGLLPLISSSGVSPTSPTGQVTAAQQQQQHNQQQQQQLQQNSSVLPSQNSSRDFKIRVRSATCPSSISSPSSCSGSLEHRDENKGVMAVRSIHCKCINIADNSEQILTKFFDEAHQFIDEARRKKCNILVHCLAGISRSPTIAIAYLMRVNSLRLQDAYNLVKQCRPQIDPNLSFMGQLMLYEKSLERKQAICNRQLSQTNSNTTASNHHQQQQTNTDSNNKLA